MSKKISVTDTILRDAHQSLLATRMRTEDMLPICDKLDKVGYWSLEVWGGATFDACVRFLKEDPWERLRKLKAALPNTRLQMLLRGQNLLGYRHYSDDVVRAFVAKAAVNGIDVFRIFDAMNDVRNLRVSIEAVKAANKHGTIVSYEWRWGDGSAFGTTRRAWHVYAKAGWYYVRLTVTDNLGAVVTRAAWVQIA